ncbi:hypothetical protein [Lacinutrix undariae]
MHYNTFEKGELFEKFVENELFKPSEYDLIHRTNSQSQNATRYAEDTLKPDFKFRCKNTNQEFYIEAKFRSGFNARDMIEVISYNQIERFKTLQKEENTPIYITIGYGGHPNNPNYISLIPLNELSYLELYDSFLRKFHIDKKSVNSNLLNLPEPQQQKPTEEHPLEKENISKKEDVNNTLILSSKNKKTALAITVALFIAVFLTFNVFKKTNEDLLKEKTIAYYSTIQSGNIDELENFIQPNVDKWYSQSNLTYTEIKEQTKSYINRHPKSKAEIQWDTFKITPLNDDYAVSYNMIYKLLKEDKGKDRIFHLKIHAIWGNDLKIKSLYEVKI